MEADEEQIQAVLEASDRSIQRSIKTAFSARETMRSTLKRLGEQGERLMRTEHNVDHAVHQAREGRDKTKELGMLNKGIIGSCSGRPKVSGKTKDTMLMEQLRRRRAEREAARDEYLATKKLIPDKQEMSKHSGSPRAACRDGVEELQLIVQDLNVGARKMCAIVDSQLTSIERITEKVRVLPHSFITPLANQSLD